MRGASRVETDVSALVDNRSLALLTLPGSVVQAVAEDAGLTGVTECFADRAYTSAGHRGPGVHR